MEFRKRSTDLGVVHLKSKSTLLKIRGGRTSFLLSNNLFGQGYWISPSLCRFGSRKTGNSQIAKFYVCLLCSLSSPRTYQGWLDLGGVYILLGIVWDISTDGMFTNPKFWFIVAASIIAVHIHSWITRRPPNPLQRVANTQNILPVHEDIFEPNIPAAASGNARQPINEGQPGEDEAPNRSK